MGTKPNRHCGTDVHDGPLTAAIVDNDDNFVAEDKFINEVDGHIKLAQWLKKNDCRHVAMESTGVYWKALAQTLISYGIDVTLTNAQLMQKVPGQKTDRYDARKLARLLRDGYLPKSNILSQESDDFRTMVRSRLRLVKERTAVKNRITALIVKCGFRMKGVSDKFGKTGRKFLKGLANGEAIDALFETHNTVVLGYSKAEYIAVLESHITIPMRKQFELWLSILDQLDEKIKKVEENIEELVNCDPERLHQVEIVHSVPGFADIASPIILSELENITCFLTSGRFSGYCGVVPVVYQSGEKVVEGKVVEKSSMGRVRSRCNKRLKWIMIQAANVVAKLKPNPLVARLQSFFRRILRRHSGRYKRAKAIVALAHKLAKIIWTLLKKDEFFIGDAGVTKDIPIRKERKSSSPPEGILSRVSTVLSSGDSGGTKKRASHS